MRRRKPYRRLRRPGKSHCRVWGSSSVCQLLEFALVVPHLLAMVIGILELGQAYNLKQKLTNAAREGARFAIEEPCADCSQAAPSTTQDIENSMVNYLSNTGVNLCGLTGTTVPTVGPQPLASWTFTSPQTCAGTSANFTIEIDRENTYASSNGGKVVCSQVVARSPYGWTLNPTIGVLLPA